MKVTRTCICGPDLHLYHGRVPDTRVGTIFGHEFCGIVTEVGSTVQNLKVGDHVLVPLNIACGTCFFCQRELYGNCHNTNPEATAAGGIFGSSHSTGDYHGGHAEYVRVPFADIGPTKIPEGMHIEDAALLTDVVPTGYQAAEMGDINEGDTVVIFGAGPIGIMAARCSWLMGAGRVIVVDHVDYRFELVAKWTPAEIVNFKEVDDMVLHLKNMTDWLGADVCIDAVGGDADGSLWQSITGARMKLQAAAAAAQWAINSVRKGGNISIVGVYGPTVNAIPLGNIVNKGLTVRANQASVKRHLPRLSEHVMAGRIGPRELITHRIPLEDVEEAYNTFSGKKDGCIKPILIPPGKANIAEVPVVPTLMH